MEGDMMKGKFTRKDNNKLLTTTRTLVGGELVQVSRSKGVDPEFNKRLHKPLTLFVFAELQLWRGGCQEDFQEAVTWILKFKFYFYINHTAQWTVSEVIVGI